MSDTLSLNLNLNYSSTTAPDDKTWSFQETITKQGLCHSIQTISTDYEALTLDDLSSTDQGQAVLHNLDTANYLLYGSTNGEFTLGAGKCALVQLSSGKTIQAKAPTAAVKLAKYVLSQ